MRIKVKVYVILLALVFGSILFAINTTTNVFAQGSADAYERWAQSQRGGADGDPTTLTQEQADALRNAPPPNELERNIITFCSFWAQQENKTGVENIECMARACDDNYGDLSTREQCKIRIAGEIVRVFGANIESSAAGDVTLKTDCKGDTLDSSNCDIIKYTIVAINILSAVAGMAIIASIMIAGYQWMTAQDNAGKVEAARTRIIWAITALLIFIFMYAFLQWLVPGGVI